MTDKYPVVFRKGFVLAKSKKQFQLLLGGKQVGVAHYKFEVPNDLFPKRYLALYKLETQSEFRRKGLMRWLLGKIFEFTKSHWQINHILLNVTKSNQAAVALYNNTGFVVYKDCDDDEEPYYTMYKNLETGEQENV